MTNDLDTFRKILGLLGSEHEGERAAAALKATAILKGMGKTWADVTVAGAPRMSGIIWERTTGGYGSRQQTDDFWAQRAADASRQQEAADRANGPWWPPEPTSRLSDAELCRQVEFYLIQHSAKAMGIGPFSLRELHRLNEDGIPDVGARLSAITILHKLWKTHRPVAA